MSETAPPSPHRIRRWFYRNERPLIVVWLVLLLTLNLLPFGWLYANRAWGLEEKMIRGYRQNWVRQVRQAEVLGRKSREAERERLEDLLNEMGPQQLRSVVGRLRQEVLKRLSLLRLELGDEQGAEAAAREMTEVDARDYRGWAALGEALWAQGLRTEAIEADGRALAINPNLEPAVARLVEYRLANDDPGAAVDAFAAYKEALWATRIFLGFTNEWPRIRASYRISIPAMVDGKRHVWRLHPAHLRGSGGSRFQKMERIDGLRLLVADEAPIGVVVGTLRMIPKGESLAPAPAPVLDVRPAADWEPAEVDGDALPGVWMSTERWKGWRAPVEIEHPDEVGVVELEIELSRPVSLGLAENFGKALRELGRENEAVEFMSGIRLASKSVSIAVAGHVRRAPDDDPPVMPALVEELPRIAADNDALVLTGDVVWEGTATRWDRFNELIREPSTIPVWIAPGNHDLHDGRPDAARTRMEERFGPTWFSRKLGSTQLLVLDTELHPGDIRGEQLEFALEEVERAAVDPSVENLVVCLHRVLWFLADDTFTPVVERANASSRPGAGNAREFTTRLMPRLEDFAAKGMVVMVAGDVGTRIPLVFHRAGNLIRVASGNRGQDPPAWWNHYLRVRSTDEGVILDAVALGGRPLGPVEQYTVEFWERHPGELKFEQGGNQ